MNRRLWRVSRACPASEQANRESAQVMYGLAALALVSVVYASPQGGHAGAGEPVTAAAVTQVGVVTVSNQVKAATTATYNNGLYTPATTTALKGAKTVARATTGVAIGTTGALIGPATSSLPKIILATTTATTATPFANAILGAAQTSSLTSSTTSSSQSSSSSSSSSSTVPSASASASSVADNGAATSSNSPSASSVAVPLGIIGAVIIIVLFAGIFWSKRRQFRAWRDRRRNAADGVGEEWNEKSDYYREGDFEAYSGAHGGAPGNWPFDASDAYFSQGDDRYGMVSSHRRSAMPEYNAPIEERDQDRGWHWGTRRSSAGQLPASAYQAEQYDDMLAQSRTGYLPSEAGRMNRQPSLMLRAGQALYSTLSLNSSRRSRRIAKLSGNENAARSGGAGGAWDEHGSWRPLHNDEDAANAAMVEKRLPATPTTPNRFSAFSGIPQDSVRKPIVAATLDSPVSRSPRRWQLADGPPMRAESPSPTKSYRPVPPSLLAGQGSSAVPELFYASAPAPSPTTRPPSASMPRLAHSRAAEDFRPPDAPFKTQADLSSGPYTAMSGAQRDAGANLPGSPRGHRIQRVVAPDSGAERPRSRVGGASLAPARDDRPISRLSQRSGSLTELVTKLLDEDEF